MLTAHRQSEATGQRGRARFPCKLCEGEHAIHRCPFLEEAKRVLEDRPILPARLPLGYQKLLPSPSPVENPVGPPRWSAEAPIIEDEPSESIPDEIQKVEATVDPVLPSEVPSSDDTITEENNDDTVQILFISTNSNEHGGNLPVPLLQEGSSSNLYPVIYSVPPPSNLVVSFD